MSYLVVDAKWGTPTNGTSSGVISYSADILNGLNYDATRYSAADFELALVAALETWEMVAAVDFELAVNPATADLTFDMVSLSGSTVGRATYSYYLLNGTDRIFDAEIVFDSSETWAPFGETDLSFYAVALHEVGHVLGLDHVNDTSEIMNPFVAGNTLGDGDVAGVRLLYGADAGDVLVPPGPEFWIGGDDPAIGGGSPPPAPEPAPEPEPDPTPTWGGSRWRDRRDPTEPEEPAPAPEPTGEDPAPEPDPAPAPGWGGPRWGDRRTPTQPEDPALDPMPEPAPEPEPEPTWGGSRWRDRLNLQEAENANSAAFIGETDAGTDAPQGWGQSRLDMLDARGDVFQFLNRIETHSHDFYVLEEGQTPEEFYASAGHHHDHGHDHDHDTGCGHGGGCDCGRDCGEDEGPAAAFEAADCFHWADNVLVS